MWVSIDRKLLVEELLAKTPEIIIDELRKGGGQLDYKAFNDAVNRRVSELVQKLAGKTTSTRPDGLWRPAYWEMRESRAILYDASPNAKEPKRDFIRLNSCSEFEIPINKIAEYRKYLAAHLELLGL